MFEETNPVEKKEQLSYTEKVWRAVAVVALLVVIILIARVAFNVLLMIMAAMLISVYFHGLGDLIQQHTFLGRKWAMGISIAGSFVLLGMLLWFMGTKIENQVAALSNTLPHTISTVKASLNKSALGQKVLDSFSGDNSNKLMATAQSFFSTGFGVLGDLYIILLLGIFFTASPSLYKDGILMLVPPAKKELGRQIINRISISLKGWLKGMLLSMVLITFLIALGLTIIGIPVALILALITGLLELIPNIGSFAAMIPGVLLAFTKGFDTALIVASFYIIAQTIVANIVTPLIQKKIINMPPALTLVSQLIMGSVTGILGIILAVPLLAIIMILVDELYVKKMNNIIS